MAHVENNFLSEAFHEIGDWSTISDIYTTSSRRKVKKVLPFRQHQQPFEVHGKPCSKILRKRPKISLLNFGLSELEVIFSLSLL